MPAIPDGENFEDFEKEMIAETKVWIANVKGKKAKRKARVRVLEETWRLA